MKRRKWKKNSIHTDSALVCYGCAVVYLDEENAEKMETSETEVKLKKNKWFKIPNIRTNEFQLQKGDRVQKFQINKPSEKKSKQQFMKRKKERNAEKPKKKTTKNQMIKNILIGYHQARSNGTKFDLCLCNANMELIKWPLVLWSTDKTMQTVGIC